MTPRPPNSTGPTGTSTPLSPPSPSNSSGPSSPPRSPGSPNSLRSPTHVISHNPPNPSKPPGHSRSPWVRPLGCAERMFASGGSLGTFNTVQAVWLEGSTHQLEGGMHQLETSVREALDSWFRKTTLLQVCVRRRRITQLWFRRITEATMDYRVVRSEAPDDVIKCLQVERYNMSTGPLWKARLVLPPYSGPGDIDHTGKCGAVFVLGVQHVLSDAFTNFVIIADFIRILNGVLASKKSAVEILEFPEYISENFACRKILKVLKMSLSKVCNMIKQNLYKNEYTFFGRVPLPGYQEERSIPSVVFRLDHCTTQKLIQRSKEKETTVHACVVTAFNSALFEMVQNQSNPPLSSVLVTYINCVNMRRYFKASDKDILGCQVSYQDQKVRVTENDLSNFWLIAKRESEILHHDLQLGTPQITLAGLPEYATFLKINNLCRKWRRTEIVDSHYITSNMGDVTKYFDTVEEANTPPPVVVVSRLQRYGSADLAGGLLTLIFETFRGRLQISCDCYPNKMSYDRVNKLLERTVEILTLMA